VLRVVLCDTLVLTLKWAEEGDLIEALTECWDVFMFDIFRIFIMSPFVYP